MPHFPSHLIQLHIEHALASLLHVHLAHHLILVFKHILDQYLSVVLMLDLAGTEDCCVNTVTLLQQLLNDGEQLEQVTLGAKLMSQEDVVSIT